MSNRWARVFAVLAVVLVRPAGAGTMEDWLRWRIEHEEQLLLEDLDGGAALEPLDWSAAAGWSWERQEVPDLEERARVFRVGVAPAPPAVTLRASFDGGPRPQAVLGVSISMGTRPVYRSTRRATTPPRVWFALGDGAGRETDDRGALSLLLRGEPDVREVQEAAVRHAGCTEAAIRSLERDARAFGALPEVTVKGGLDGGWDRELDPFGNTTEMGEDQAWDVQLELEWDLADLAMSYERIRVQAERQDLVEHRAEVLEAVTVAYYDRQHLRARLRSDEPRTGAERLELELALEQVTALLDGMTGEAFSRLLEEARESD